MIDIAAIRRLKERRRPWDRLERKVVKMHLRHADSVPDTLLDTVRYVISFARLTVVRNRDGEDIDVSGPLALHAQQVREVLEPSVELASDLWEVVRVLPELSQKTRVARASLLEHLPIDRESLEREVTQRNLVVVSGGGGGAGYVYLGAYQLLARHDHVPDLLVGTSIGALTSLFRARRRPFELAPIVEASKHLAWGNVLRVLESESRYGLPATLRIYLREALSELFLRDDGEPLRLSDLPIKTYVMATGITVDALKHDLDYYEHLIEGDVGRSTRDRVRGVTRAISVLREFIARRDALVELALGWSPGTEEFDALDAAGFSASVPGVLHYDVLRDDERMRRLLDDLYAAYGITRLGEGGMVANVAARVGWASSVGGDLGVRQPFVLALDCFAPNPRRIAWLPIQQLVRAANVDRDRKYADLYLPMPRTLSPMNVVPPIRDALLATRWGRDALQPHMPYINLMMRPIQVLDGP
ncbi:MAG: patatin-like phospholipase family protein [Deltaproteobacteria bacterium]|nr:MAG: patatin-like phospholipase family protein [Deltaproteobacteria bacterium]